MTRNLPVVRKSCLLLKYIRKIPKLSIFKIEKLLKNHAISWFHNNVEVNSMHGFGWWNQNLFDINVTSMSSNISLLHFFISYVVGSFLQLKFGQGLKQRWKVEMFFIHHTLACSLYWTLGLLLGLWPNSYF